MSKLLSFLRGDGLDAHGRKLDDILSMDDAALEHDHYYIQWLFPLKTLSQNIPGSPVITTEEIRQAIDDEVVQQNMHRGLERMTQFYAKNNHWLSELDHNHFRISRILTATRSLLGDAAALRFYSMLMERLTEADAEVSQFNIQYWKVAMDEGVDEFGQPKIYLDINGVLTYKDITENRDKAAAGLEEFLTTLRPYDVYWLTMHCTDGDPTSAQNKIKEVVSEAFFDDVEQIKPTVWQTHKTEAIDFKSPFIWFDSNATNAERMILKRCIPGQSMVEVNLHRNPYQLIEIIRDVL